VAEWTLHTKRALGESRQQLQVISTNWKEAKEKESPDLLSISELFSQRKLCYLNVYACISKMVPATSPTSHLGHLSVIDKHSLKERNELSEISLLLAASYAVHLYITKTFMGKTYLP